MWWFGKNSMFFDLGYDNLSEEESYINKAITEMDAIFDLVLITEYFDESLILMKELLSWSWDDILYVKVNSRKQNEEQGEENSHLEALTRRWTKADAALYDYFNATLWRKIAAYGVDRMAADLVELARRKEGLKEKCILSEVKNSEVVDPHNKVDNPHDIDMTGYILKPSAVNDTLCQGVIRSEIPWFRYFSSKQARIKRRPA